MRIVQEVEFVECRLKPTQLARLRQVATSGKRSARREPSCRRASKAVGVVAVVGRLGGVARNCKVGNVPRVLHPAVRGAGRSPRSVRVRGQGGTPVTSEFWGWAEKKLPADGSTCSPCREFISLGTTVSVLSMRRPIEGSNAYQLPYWVLQTLTKNDCPRRWIRNCECLAGCRNTPGLSMRDAAQALEVDPRKT